MVPTLVLAEAGYLISRALGQQAEARFLRSAARGDVDLEAPSRADLERMAELVETYADLRLGTVDASVVALAERLGATTLATLDRRHFRVVRPKHAEALTLLPA